MARKLPWASDGSPAPRKAYVKDTATKPSISIVSETNFTRKESRPVTPEPIPTPRLQRKRVTSRSPSSSPIRRSSQSVPQIEPMKSYSDYSDDRYIMVEDEFEAIAKSFTAHLHAAEYDRLRRKAREHPPEVKFKAIANMPVTVKQSLEQRKLRDKQGRALRQVMGRDNGEDEDEGARPNDPWSGTSLAGLMGEGESTKRSLVGLNRLNSSTRAAKGFGRGRNGTENGVTGLGKRSVADIFSMVAEDDNKNKVTRGSKDTAERSRLPKNGTKMLHEKDFTRSKRLNTNDTLEQSSTAKFKTTTSAFNRPRIRARSYVDDLDDFDEGEFDNSSSVSSSPLTKPTIPKFTSPLTKQDQRSRKEKDRKSRLDEVPLFLV